MAPTGIERVASCFAKELARIPRLRLRLPTKPDRAKAGASVVCEARERMLLA
jgi:hypothetical protein